MASDVDICNLALSRLGDTANVTTINPPDSSAQAGHCQRFYPIARDSLLEMYSWNFSVRRAQLAPVTNLATEWKYCYSVPVNMVNIDAIYDPEAPDDITFGVPQYHNTPTPYATSTGVGLLTPQNFVMESDANGNQVIYSNQPNAVARITVRVIDTTKFSPLFVDALAWLLASYLAGPVLKGDVGVQAGSSCWKTFLTVRGMAMESDANQRRQQPNQQVTAQWMVNR